MELKILETQVFKYMNLSKISISYYPILYFSVLWWFSIMMHIFTDIILLKPEYFILLMIWVYFLKVST